MATKYRYSKSDLRDEFARADERSFLSRAVVAAALNRTPSWLHSMEKRGLVPPFVELARSRLYRKSDVIAYFLTVKPEEESAERDHDN